MAVLWQEKQNIWRCSSCDNCLSIPKNEVGRIFRCMYCKEEIEGNCSILLPWIEEVE